MKRCAYCSRRGSSMRNAICWTCTANLGSYPPGSIGDVWYQAYLKIERMGKALPWGFRYVWGRQVRAMVRAKRESDDRMHRAQREFLVELISGRGCNYCRGLGCPECTPMGRGAPLI